MEEPAQETAKVEYIAEKTEVYQTAEGTADMLTKVADVVFEDLGQQQNVRPVFLSTRHTRFKHWRVFVFVLFMV